MTRPLALLLLLGLVACERRSHVEHENYYPDPPRRESWCRPGNADCGRVEWDTDFDGLPDDEEPTP